MRVIRTLSNTLFWPDNTTPTYVSCCNVCVSRPRFSYDIWVGILEGMLPGLQGLYKAGQVLRI